MEDYVKNFDSHEQSVLAYVSDIQSSLNDAYANVLSPLENNSDLIPNDYFHEVSSLTSAMDQVTPDAIGDKNCMKDELDKIAKAMQTCKVGSSR